MDRQAADSAEVLNELADAWAAARSVVVLTGAGISTASGIPDFRSQGGRWESYQPVTLQEFRLDPQSRTEYWRYKGETWQVIQAAEPNAAHDTLRDLALADRLQLLVTQNVDGLHERGGFPADRLIWIHGTDSEVECLACGVRQPRSDVQQRWAEGEEVPLCPCGGFLKPATISFGQGLVMDDLRRSFAAAESCDLFVAAGTSLVVSPINQMLPLARRAGARVAILTASDTPYDAEATWTLRDPLEKILPALRERMLGPGPG